MERIIALFKSIPVILSCLIIAMAIYMMVLAVPGGDDFCFGSVTVKHGFWGGLSFWYETWTGRFASSFIMALSTANPNMLFYSYFLPLFASWGMFFWAAQAMLKTTATALGSENNAPLSAAAVLTAFSLLFANPHETILWQAGTVTYIMGFSMVLLSAVWAINLMLLRQTTSLQSLILLGVWNGIACGFSELTTGLLLATQGLILVAAIITRGWSKNHFIPVAGALIGTAALILSPGNLLRSSTLAAKTPVDAILTGIERTNIVLLKRFNSYLSTLLMGLIVGTYCASAMNTAQKKTPIWSVPATLAITLTLLWCSVFPRMIVSDAYDPSRAITIDVLILFLGGAISGMLFFHWLRQQWKLFKNPACVAVTSILIITTSFLLFVTYDYRGNNNPSSVMSQSYTMLLHGTTGKALLNERYLIIQKALLANPKPDPLEVPAYNGTAIPPSMSRDIVPDRAHWHNVCVSNYFGLPGITIAKPAND